MNGAPLQLQRGIRQGAQAHGEFLGLFEPTHLEHGGAIGIQVPADHSQTGDSQAHTAYAPVDCGHRIVGIEADKGGRDPRGIRDDHGISRLARKGCVEISAKNSRTSLPAGGDCVLASKVASDRRRVDEDKVAVADLGSEEPDVAHAATEFEDGTGRRLQRQFRCEDGLRDGPQTWGLDALVIRSVEAPEVPMLGGA